MKTVLNFVAVKKLANTHQPWELSSLHSDFFRARLATQHWKCFERWSVTSNMRYASRMTKLLCFPIQGMQKAVEGLTTLSVWVLGCLEESKAKIVYSERKAGSAIIPARSCLIQGNEQRHKHKIKDEKTNHKGILQSSHPTNTHNTLVALHYHHSTHRNSKLLGRFREMSWAVLDLKTQL